MSTHQPKLATSNTKFQYQDFYGRDFLVTPDVLTPRPETEQLIDLAKSLAGQPILPGVKAPPRALPEYPVICDVGTGSGCIAITLALELPEATIIASDISAAAIKIAAKNAAAYGVTPLFIISHLLQKVKHNLDLVVANLPYVDKSWPWVDQQVLKSDPSLALYAEDGGLALIKALINQCENRHIPRLLLEADPCQHTRLVTYAAAHGYHHDRTMGFALSFKL